MKNNAIRKVITPFFPLLDVLLAPFTILSAVLLKLIRVLRVRHFPVSMFIFKKVGVFPIRDHYYEPQFNFDQLSRPLTADRSLNGINWNIDGQLALINSFVYRNELSAFPWDKPAGVKPVFYFNNPSFGPGDAEFLYAMIRKFRPGKIIEIGSGYSTLMAQAAIDRNRFEDPSYSCRHTCIEPYEMPWLESTGVEVVREVVEKIPLSFFEDLNEHDILFIDSSHVIRPQGDVLYEFLELLPSIQKGVIVHVHDIFSPRDYTDLHLKKDVLFWNEQYILEAFLTCNKEFEVLGSLHHLKQKYPAQLQQVFPYLGQFPAHEPGSFWIRKV
ncbi:class I SAM-dependent methyltransferase [Parasegetibacter sp. NRK P23]|uniref:class I SAM-dependent methyltransferase n=1 Tax=Parasegetibacter sp. NRK P23 TaxID=2942999 RepID=UPI0020441722|nr:class I SAM-dependent methyltransferase [Parasegetibacter sp. NRK P23]MCM5527510.1 class I SAM-dependent methyltransferase [Parasegetibacter sp. NRK P23]